MIQLIFNHFSKVNNLTHLITTREGGISSGLYSSLNLSYLSGDDHEKVSANRNKVASEFGIPYSSLLIPQQCHTNNIRVITSHEDYSDLTETDGLITNIKRLCIGILAADCVPILMFDPVSEIICAIHAGWRGTVNEIQTRAVQLMTDNFGSDPLNILAGIGPSICQKHYNVNEDVVAEFNNKFYDTSEFIVSDSSNYKFYIDLQHANKIKLIESGIQENNIEIIGLCTWENNDRLFSARRDGFNSGRFGSFIMMPE